MCTPYDIGLADNAIQYGFVIADCGFYVKDVYITHLIIEYKSELYSIIKCDSELQKIIII